METLLLIVTVASVLTAFMTSVTVWTRLRDAGAMFAHDSGRCTIKREVECLFCDLKELIFVGTVCEFFFRYIHDLSGKITERICETLVIVSEYQFVGNLKRRRMTCFLFLIRESSFCHGFMD